MARYGCKSIWMAIKRRRSELSLYILLLVSGAIFTFYVGPTITGKYSKTPTKSIAFDLFRFGTYNTSKTVSITQNMQQNENVIQYEANIPSSELCHKIQRPTENELQRYKDVYHYVSHFNNDSRAYILNTYCDNRVRGYEDIIIRTVTTANFDLTITGIYGSFWYPGLNVAVSIKCEVFEGPGPAGPNAWHYGFKRYTIACTIPRLWSQAPPEKVSLSVTKCQRPMNYIDVVTPLPKDPTKPNMIGNCMQSLYGSFGAEFALMFVNWIETITMYGVSEVTVNLNNFTNTDLGRKIFKHYIDKGILKITTYPDIVSPHTRMREQTVGRIQSFIQLPFVDCFFKNMHRYWYFLPIDVDELFVLKGKYKTYQEYINSLIRKDPMTKNSIFLTTHLAGYYLNYMPANMSVPEYLPLFRYTKRDRLRIGGHKKSFQNPRTCIFAGYHACRPLSQSKQACEQCGYRPMVLPPDEIVLNHYRHSCKRNDGCLEPKRAILDDELFEQETGQIIQQRVKETLLNIGYFKTS